MTALNSMVGGEVRATPARGLGTRWCDVAEGIPALPVTDMPRSEESKLIARARRGDAEAFRALVDAYKDRLFAFVWRMVRNHHEAEDIAQSAFVKAYEALATYSEKWAFSTWLFTIAYRLCVNHLRRRKPLHGEGVMASLGTGEADTHETVANTEEARRLREMVWTAVDDLSPQQKSAVLLFYREGKSCEEIGQVLDMPAVTVKSHLHRARARLREALQAEWSERRPDIRVLGDTRYA